VIASLQGCNLVIAVIEAGSSGIRDAERLFQLLATMNRPTVCVINKQGIDAGMDQQARDLAARYHLPLVAELPFDKRFQTATELARSWHDCQDIFVQTEARKLCAAVFEAAREFGSPRVPLSGIPGVPPSGYSAE
jgi:MinD superfamily P-loop ATPase